MKNPSLLTLLAILLSFTFSCTPPATETVDIEMVKKEISDLGATWAAAINAKDIDAQMALLADDVHIMHPNKPAIVGKEALRAAHQAEMAADTSGMKTTIAFASTDVWASGNIAAETGTWTVSSEGGEVLDKGKYMTLWEKRDGKYLCIRDIYNSDMPPPAAPLAAAKTESKEE